MGRLVAVRTTEIIIIAMLLLVALPITSLSDQNRHALVVGNGAYEESPLKNPANDANGMAALLRDLGFSVTTKINVTHQELEDAIRAFGRSLHPGDVALFYFSGHGTQIDRINYLLPIGPPIQREHEIKYKALNSNMILEEMAYARSSLNIVILDACRINPFRGFRALRRGLASMSAPTVSQGGTLIAYATAPHTVARDGEGKNSPYAAHLIQAISIPGLEIEHVFKQVRVRVMAETNNEQVPWESSSLTRPFFFKPVSAATLPPERGEIARQSPPIPNIAPPTKPAPPPRMDERPQPKDYSEKLRRLVRLIEKGNDRARKDMGRLYKDSEAMAWIRNAANQGDSDAQFALGRMYHLGNGVPKDYNLARDWYLKAAARSCAGAECNLGYMYHQGLGVPPDRAAALEWFRRAAAHGDTDAKRMLETKFNE